MTIRFITSYTHGLRVSYNSERRKGGNNGSELGGFESDTGSVHEATRPQVPSMDARSCSTPSHRVGALDSRRRVRDAAYMDSRPPQYFCFPHSIFLFRFYRHNCNPTLSVERTFIILDKDLVSGEFVHGDPHVEGQFYPLPS